MTGLKKLLLVVLVLSTLGYSSAWAFDEHVLDQLQTDSSKLDTASGDLSDEQNNSKIACDHCGHIFSHLVAIFPDTKGSATEGSKIYLSSLTQGLNSFIPGPDRKPPRL